MESFSNVASSAKKDLTLEDFPALGKSSESLFVKDFEFNTKAVGGGGGPRMGFVPSKSKEQDKFGLLGLIDLVRMTNEDLSTLSLGTDLSALGLNLNGSEHIYQSFMSPFSDQPSVEPEFSLSPVYSLSQVTPKMASYSDETLFYIFYAFPRDAMQEAAAQELYGRSWRYHKELKLWLSKDPAMVSDSD
jgi:CCR4-NOT transcription complex subunit 2